MIFVGQGEEACPSQGRWLINDWNLEEAIGKGFLFFEAQKSGELPAGHRVKWRGDSYLHDEHKGRLLNRGWFDAGGVLSMPHGSCSCCADVYAHACLVSKIS